MQHLSIILPRMAVRSMMSSVMSVCFPIQGLISNCPYIQKVVAIRSETIRSFYSTTVASSSVYGFYHKCVCRHRTSVPHNRSLWPMVQSQCRSTSAASDVFPKRVTRRTKKKDILNQSQVDQVLKNMFCLW